MSEKLNEITEGSFLRVNKEGKAYWGQPEGGGGIFIVNLNMAAKTYDKSLSEIFDAHKKGCIIVAKIVQDTDAGDGTIMHSETVAYLGGIIENFKIIPDSEPFDTAVVYVPGISLDTGNKYYYLFKNGKFSDKLAE